MKQKNIGVMKILPSEIAEKYNYIKVDNIYTCVMTIISYDKVTFLDFLENLFLEDEITVSFQISKQNGNEFLKKITRFLVESGAEIKTIKEHQIDMDILAKNKKEAEEIKKEVQINGEEIFLVEAYIKLNGKTEVEVATKCNNLKNKLYSYGIILRPAFFKQKEAYVATLPLLEERKLIKEYTQNIFLTTSLSMLFPFFVKDNITEGGVFIGKINNKYSKFSLLTENNLNHNMCVFGSSGVGKSFYIKLLILRKSYLNINQIIIDPEGEYEGLVKMLGGTVWNITTYNPMLIEENFAKRNIDFFGKTIALIRAYIEEKYEYKGNGETVVSAIYNLYSKYGINERIESLYEHGNEQDIYILPKYKDKFPKLSELLEMLDIKDETLNEEVQVNKSSNLVCFSLKTKTSEEIDREMKVFMPKIKSLIYENTLIYFDEIWKLLNSKKSGEIIEEIYDFFKTLRKRQAGIVAISQDIGDLFNIDNGNFGKSILNNSYTKIFFKMSYADMEKMKILTSENIDVRNLIFKLSRGQAYFIQGETKCVLDIIANDYEKDLIEKEIVNEENFNSNG